MSWRYASEKPHRSSLKSRSSRLFQALDGAETRSKLPRKVLVSKDIPKNLCSQRLPNSLIDLRETFHLNPRCKVNTYLNSVRCHPSIVSANEPHIYKKTVSADTCDMPSQMGNFNTSLDLSCGDYCSNCRIGTEKVDSSLQFHIDVPSKSSLTSPKMNENLTHYYLRKDSSPSLKQPYKVDLKRSDKSLESLVKVSKNPSVIAVQDDSDSLRDIKIFREANYFETHSVNHIPKPAAKDHKCKYHFYLNDRLFVKPINTDNNGNIRCLDCNLPLHLNKQKPDSLNGFIEAKVTIESDPSHKDATLFLPITKDLVIDQWKKGKVVSDPNEQTIYFGIVNLDYMRKFTSLPPTTDSFALRYQRGFRQLTPDNRYHISGLSNEEVIIT